MKKRLLLVGIVLLTVIVTVNADPEIEKADSARYAHKHTSITHPQSAASKYSSVSTSVVHSTQTSLKNSVPTTQKPLKPAATSNNAQYNVQEQLQPPTANAAQFFFGVKQASNTAQGFIPTAGPMLMQILTPQGQPTGQVQYIQFLRPVMMPLVPQAYMQASIVQPLPQPAAQTSAGVIAQQYLPTSTPLPPNGGLYTFAQQPLQAAFSSSVASYYHPNIYSTNRVQMVNAPADLSLNTDEYMPVAASEMSYKVMKPLMR